uniref:Bidirectional sugar transporter SWEET n=1 Tax=Kalanchoe fedtschenkoi TaxID=63787 RepID=A0A7N0T471_KALFE
MLYVYYALLKQENGMILITINTVGLIVETAYLVIYLIYATPYSRILTTRIILILNLGTYGLVIFITSCAFKGEGQITAAGWTCAVFSVCVFIAPLSIMCRVIKTKSVRYMPLALSVMLTLCAVIWFFYGLLTHDYFIAFPNILGFTFSIAQIALYAYHRNQPAQNAAEQELSTHPNVNEEQPADARFVHGGGDHISGPVCSNLPIDNAVDNRDEVQEIHPITIMVVV